jgi:hypothetical protein
LAALCSFKSFQLQRDKIVTVGALQLNDIPFPPGKFSTELKRLKAGKDVMIEKPAQIRRIVTAYFKGFSGFVAGTATPLDTHNGGNQLVADFRILSHIILLQILVYGNDHLTI